jgi:hypothetical protein
VNRFKHHYVAALVFFALLLGPVNAGASASAEPVVLGQQGLDFSTVTSGVLTKRAWDALAAKDFEVVFASTGKCRELFEAEARQQHSSLTAIIPAIEREKILALSALNDVAACYFIAGQARELQGNTAAAVSLYRDLAKLFPYAQCWDTKGWFWRPAAEGRTRMFRLEFEAAAL